MYYYGKKYWLLVIDYEIVYGYGDCKYNQLKLMNKFGTEFC